MKGWLKWWKAWSAFCLVSKAENQEKQPDDIKLINEAKDEIVVARLIFAEMEDPEMIDWAVYNVSAAEKRYDHLLKMYKQKKGYQMSTSEIVLKGCDGDRY